MRNRRDEQRAQTRDIRRAAQLLRAENWNPSVANLTALSVAVNRVTDYLFPRAANNEIVARYRDDLIAALRQIQKREHRSRPQTRA